MTKKFVTKNGADLEYVDPSTLVPWDRNPRVNEHAVEPVAESIKRFGFGAPVVARPSDRRVLAGHTRLKAATLLGLDRVPVRWLELTDGEADAYALADNRLGELATWDDATLRDVLGEMKAEDVVLDGLGWDDAALIALLGKPPEVELEVEPDPLPADRARILVGDVVEKLRELPDASVHCVVTSPPYWGLRDYGVEGQGGLEKTPEEHVEWIVGVFREVARVLRPNGTAWVNYGDCYSGDKTGGRKHCLSGLKPKDLVGMPWRVAFALQADGWYLRSDIVWHKPNPMPESVTDRPTKAHEFVFLLAHPKSGGRYYYDADAVREAHEGSTRDRKRSTNFRSNPAGRNLRDVWTIPTQPYAAAHFATFPEALVEPCVRAGTSARGACPECGAPWKREVDRDRPGDRGRKVATYEDVGVLNRRCHRGSHPASRRETIGWSSTCEHDAEPVPATVLDPFAGSGTTGAVALRSGRAFVGCELNPEYAKLAHRRIAEALAT